MHAYKTPKQYNIIREAMKAYTNKLMIGISTAGDNEQGFLGQRLKYCRKVLDGTIRDDQYFIFMCCAPEGVKDGTVDFTDPKIQEMANPRTVSASGRRTSSTMLCRRSTTRSSERTFSQNR